MTCELNLLKINTNRRVIGVEKLDIKSNFKIISLKMCFGLIHALCGTQILR